jgi:hypothetical protein
LWQPTAAVRTIPHRRDHVRTGFIDIGSEVTSRPGEESGLKMVRGGEYQRRVRNQ